MNETNEQEKFEGFVELMGRHVIAGYVSEQVIAGAAMLRVDVPAVGDLPGFTKYFGGAAIYGLTPTDEATAKRAVVRLRPRPVEPWIVPVETNRRLVDTVGDDDDDEFGSDRPPF